MQIQEIQVADDTPATPVADGQLPNENAPAAPTDNQDVVLDIPAEEAVLNKDLEDVEGEYGPPAEAIGEAGEALEVARDDEEEAHEAIVALESYFLLTKQAIENKTCSMESLQLIRMGVEPYLKSGKLGGLALEGREGATLELQHQLALEGIKESIKSALHSVHTAQSAYNDNIKMIFTSIEHDVERYRAGLAKAVAKFSEFTKANPKEELHLDLHIIENFFNFSKKSENLVVPTLAVDERFDEYVLTKFSVACEKQLEALANAIQSSKSFAEVIGKVEKLKHPIELFESKWLASSKDGHTSPLLGGYYAYVRQIAWGGFKQAKFDKLSRLEQLGSSARVAIAQEFGNADRAMKSATNPITFAVVGAFSPVLKVKPSQIREIADAAVLYLKNIEFFLQILKTTAKTHEMASERFKKFEAADVNSKQADKVYSYMKSLDEAVTSTCRAEVTRALKAVFYCIALVNRATYVNK